MSQSNARRLTPVDPHCCAVLEARIADAAGALAALDAAGRPSPSARALSDVALRREAVAAARIDGAIVTFDDLLLFEALPPVPTTVDASCDRAVEAGVVLATRYLAALRLGRSRVESDGVLSADGLLTVLKELSGVPCVTLIPAAVARAVEEIEDALRDASCPVSAIVTASMVERRLSELDAVMHEIRMLRRIITVLLLSPRDRPGFCLLSPSVRRLARRSSSAADATAAIDTESSAVEHATRLADDTVSVAADALRLVERLTSLAAEDEERIRALSKAAHSARRVHLALQRRPIIALPDVLPETGLHVQAATSALHRLRGLGIVRELTRHHRHRVYRYESYVDAASDGVA